MLQLFIDGDHKALRRFWFETCPSLPQPESDEQAEIAMHMARTSMEVLPEKLRLWSHRWLKERGHASQLPNELMGKAERLKITLAHTVGLSFNTSDPELQPVMNMVREMVETQIMDAFSAPEVPDTETLKGIIADTSKAEIRKLLG